MTQHLPGEQLVPPQVDAAPHDIYQGLLDRDVLAFQACGQCAEAVFPPQGRCRYCGADALTWRTSRGRGAVYSATVITPRDKPAYCVVLVDLDEGYRMMSRITGADAEAVAIGDRLDVRFEPVGDTVLPVFTVLEVADA